MPCQYFLLKTWNTRLEQWGTTHSHGCTSSMYVASSLYKRHEPLCRVVYIVGSPNATLVQQSKADLAGGNSSNPALSSAVVLPSAVAAATPDSFLTWSIDDNTDLLQVGYLGSLTLEALTLKLAFPCCVTISLVGNWYFSNQPLPWNIFGTILPGAFSVQAVRVPQLNAPAFLVLRNVRLLYASCDSSFAAAAELLVSKANAQYEGAVQNGVSFENKTITCTACVFQGSEQVPSVYGNQVSQVELYDTSITCLDSDLGAATANGTNTTSQNSTTAATVATAGASWAPPVWLSVFLTVVTCAAVILGLFALWRYIYKQQEAAQFTSLQEARHLHPSNFPSRRSSAAFTPGYVQRTKSALGQPMSAFQVQNSKLSIVYPPSRSS